MRDQRMRLTALLAALIVTSSSLTGCDWFDRPAEDEKEKTSAKQEEIQLEIPKPKDYELDEELTDKEEQTAQEDTSQPQTIKEDDKSEKDKTQGSTNKVEESKTPVPSGEDRFVDSGTFADLSKEPEQVKITTSVMAPEKTNRPEHHQNVVYQPVGTEPAPKQEVKVVAQPAAVMKLPVPEANKKYTSARFKEKGLYDEAKVYKNGYIDCGGLTITNKTFTGDVIVNVSSGDVTLKNVKINGKLILKDGTGWVKLYDAKADQLVIDSSDLSKVFVSRSSGLGSVLVKSSAVLEEGGLYDSARGFANLTVDAPKGTKLNFTNVRLNQIKTKTASDVVVDRNSIINYFYTEAPTELYGSGQINRLYCRSNGVYYDTKPLYMETSKGFAAPSRRNSGSGDTKPQQDKKVTLYDIQDQYLDVGDTRRVGIDHNGSSLKVTTTNSKVAKVTYSTSKSRITMTGLKPGTATIRVTSSREGYQSKTISFTITVKGTSTESIQLSPVRDQYMDVNDSRYITVNTNASSIQVTNSNPSVVSLDKNGFRLHLTAKKSGYSDIRIVAHRSGRPSKVTTFRVRVAEPQRPQQDSVIINPISDQIINLGDYKPINVRTDAQSITATSSNTNVVKVTANTDNTLTLEPVGRGTAQITVVGKRSGMKDSITWFSVNVSDQLTVNLRHPNGYTYPERTWTKEDVIIELTGYDKNQNTAYKYERNKGESASAWRDRQEVRNGVMKISAEGQKEYYFFTTGKDGTSPATAIYSVYIDKTAPVYNSVRLNSNTVEFTASDALSGVRTIEIRNITANTSTYLNPNTSGSYKFIANQTGYYQIIVWDNAGNYTESTSYSLTVPTTADTTLPTIAVDNEPTSMQWFNSDREISMTITDDRDTNLAVSILPDVPFTKTTGGKYSFTANKEGTQIYTVRATDDSGNTQTRQITVNLDKTAPIVTDITTEPITGSYTQKVSFKVTEAGGSGISIGNIKAAPVADPKSAENITEKNGIYSFTAKNNATYTITVTDNAGNVSLERTVEVKSPVIDMTKVEPSVKISDIKVQEPSTLSTEKGVQFTVDAKTNQGQKLVVNLISPKNISLTGMASLLDMNNTYTFLVDENGTYTARAEIWEDGKVVKTAEQTVVIDHIDNTAPVINVTDNREGTVTFTVSDEHQTEVFFDGAKIADANGTYIKSNLSAGEHTILAKDVADNKTVQKVKVVRTPFLTVINTAIHSADKKNASMEITADTFGGKIIRTQVDKSGATLSKTAENVYQFNAAANGTYHLTFTTEDGTKAELDLTVTGISEDKVSPTIIVSAQQVNDSATVVTVPITVSDNETPAEDIAVSADNGKLTGKDGNYILTVTENGTYTITAKDQKGNTSNMGIVVDSIKGNIEPILTRKDITADNKEAQIIFTVDTNGGTDIVSVYDQNNDTITANANGDYVMTVTENGKYIITAKNKAGRTKTLEVSVDKIDKVLPVIETPVVTYNAPAYNEATITVKATDAIVTNGEAKADRIASMTLSQEHLPMTKNSDGSWTIKVKSNGNYLLTATDLAGNVSTSTVLVGDIDGTKPVITVTSKNDTWAKSQTVTFTVTDEGKSGLNTVTVTHKDKAVKAVNDTVQKDGWSFNASENGEYIITATDMAGNTQTHTVKVEKADNINPTAPQLKIMPKTEKEKEILIPAYNAKTNSKAYETTETVFTPSFIKEKDGESPVKFYVKKDKEKEFTAFNPANPKTITLTKGEHEIWLRAVDAVGNESKVQWKIKVTDSKTSDSKTTSDNKTTSSDSKTGTSSGTGQQNNDPAPVGNTNGQQNNDPVPKE